MWDYVQQLVKWRFFTACITFIAKVIWGIIPPSWTEYFCNRKKQNQVIKAKYKFLDRKIGLNAIIGINYLFLVIC